MPRIESPGKNPPSRIWITWESQRRSLNLSAKVSARLFLFDDESRGRLRYLISGWKTFRALAGNRGGIVFVQNPSMLLAALACVLKPWLGFKLVVDRHTAHMDPTRNQGFKNKVVQLLSRFTLRKADLTLVTNRELLEIVERIGGRGFILPDPYPDFVPTPRRTGNGPLEVLFVSSWASDEPIAEMSKACEGLEGEAVVYISGRMKKTYAELSRGFPPNFIPTGFLSDEDYFKLMGKVDAVAAITTRGATLVCGAYEAISMGKPLILGDTPVLRDYFSAGALYTDSSAADLAAKIRLMKSRLQDLQNEVSGFREASEAGWNRMLLELNRILETI